MKKNKCSLFLFCVDIERRQQTEGAVRICHPPAQTRDHKLRIAQIKSKDDNNVNKKESSAADLNIPPKNSTCSGTVSLW
jgi:hypothetical protein